MSGTCNPSRVHVIQVLCKQDGDRMHTVNACLHMRHMGNTNNANKTNRRTRDKTNHIPCNRETNNLRGVQVILRMRGVWIIAELRMI